MFTQDPGCHKSAYLVVLLDSIEVLYSNVDNLCHRLSLCRSINIDRATRLDELSICRVGTDGIRQTSMLMTRENPWTFANIAIPIGLAACSAVSI